MGRQEPSGISGKVGSVIYYVYDGKQYVKAAGPTQIKQTAATKATASKFGLISGLSKTIRSVLPDFMKPLNNRETRNRLTSALVEWMHPEIPRSTRGRFESIHGISHFEFNKEAPLRKKLKLPLEVQWDLAGKVIVSIPELSLSKHIPLPPGHIEPVELWISVISCTPEDGETISMDNITIAISTSGNGLVPAQQVELLASALPGSLNVVVAGLQYVYSQDQGHSKVQDPRWMSARILDAVYKADEILAEEK